MTFESAKPLEPGCLCMVIGILATTHQWCYVGERVPPTAYPFSKKPENKEVWETDRAFSWHVKGEGLRDVCMCPACYLIRIDDPDLQKEISAEQEKEKPRERDKVRAV